MSRKQLNIGSRVIVGLSGSKRWIGTVVDMEKTNPKENDWLFQIRRDQPKNNEILCYVQDRNVQLLEKFMANRDRMALPPNSKDTGKE